MQSTLYKFSAKAWQYEGPAGWVFVSLPLELAKKIRSNFKEEEEGWGRLKATATIGNTKWATAIWFDTKANTYLLPLKAVVRKKEGILVGRKVNVEMQL